MKAGESRSVKQMDNLNSSKVSDCVDVYLHFWVQTDCRILDDFVSNRKVIRKASYAFDHHGVDPVQVLVSKEGVLPPVFEDWKNNLAWLLCAEMQSFKTWILTDVDS